VSNTIWDPFFWNDWQNDQALKLCPLAAQAIWMRCLCVCAQATKRGYLLVDGIKPTDADLAKLFGCTAEEVATNLAIIKAKNVCGVTRDGILYSRRMIREAKKKAASRKGGKKGGQTTHRNKKGIFATQAPHSGEGVDDHSTPNGARARVSIPIPIPNSKEVQDSGLVSDFDGWYEAYPRKVGRAKAEIAYDRALEKVPHDVLLRGAQTYARERQGEPDKYTKHPATWLNGEHWNDYPLKNGHAAASVDDGRATQFRAMMATFKNTGIWLSMDGPKPGEKGCVVPAAILKEFGYG
jgi:hypothetical protein